ncbi:hypothetical protein ACTL32_18365 [Planococcus sp. FY231025]|uniref:hypothetical protein n=1 Tax=Planococcus sp. FY231025 TaxID=3455699 RepID=UPI003F8F34FF
MFEWLFENKEWVFSGIGIPLLTLIIRGFWKKSNEKQVQADIHAGNYSTNIQNSNNIKVKNGRVEDDE